MIGKTVGKYRFVEEIGRDGASAIFKAIDETLDREVAVKVLNPHLSDSEVMKHFQAEATTLARLHHPDIAGIHEIHRTDSDLLLVMELVRGETLEAFAARSGQLPPERAAYLVAQVLGALEHAHGAGVVHRDLKPANITITESGGIKVRDFGLARVAGEDDATSDGFVLASPAYMAPERLAGKEIDGRADMYSAGVIFYRLLTGHVPFEATSPLEMVQKQLSATATPAVRHRPGLPGWCQAILDRALARSPEERFPSAEAFRRTLLAAITEASEATGAFAVVKDQPAAGPADDHTIAVPITAARTGSLPSAGPPTVAAYAPPPAPVVQAPPPTAVPAPAGPAAQAGGHTTIVLKKNQFAAIGGLLAALVLAIAVLAFVALRRAAPATPSAPVPATAQAEATPPAADTVPAASAREALSAKPAENAAPPSSAADAAPRKAAGDARAARPAPAAAPAPAAVKRDASPPRVIPNTTPFTFEAKAVVAEGDKRREKDAVVTLADGAITVRDRGEKSKSYYVLPIDALTNFTYSNSRQPLWNSPDGPAEAMRVEGGAFGFLKGGRNWFGLRTSDALLMLRVDDEQVAKVTVGLEERTGLKLERIVERKDATRKEP